MSGIPGTKGEGRLQSPRNSRGGKTEGVRESDGWKIRDAKMPFLGPVVKFQHGKSSLCVDQSGCGYSRHMHSLYTVLSAPSV